MSKKISIHQGVRVHKKSVQTAVLTYGNDKHVITVVGTQHFGERSYFEALSDVVAAREAAGDVVQYEGIKPVFPDGYIPTPAEMTAQEQWKNRSPRTIEMLRAMDVDLISQKEGLPESPEWENVDATFPEMLKLLGLDYFSQNVGPDPEKIEAAPSVIKAMARWRFAHSMRKSVAQASDVESKVGDHAGVIMHWRSVEAVRRAMATPGNVTMLWGAGHLLGVGAILGRTGYRQQGQAWITSLAAKWPRCEPAAEGAEPGIA